MQKWKTLMVNNTLQLIIINVLIMYLMQRWKINPGLFIGQSYFFTFSMMEHKFT